MNNKKSQNIAWSNIPPPFYDDLDDYSSDSNPPTGVEGSLTRAVNNQEGMWEVFNVETSRYEPYQCAGSSVANVTITGTDNKITCNTCGAPNEEFNKMCVDYGVSLAEKYPNDPDAQKGSCREYKPDGVEQQCKFNNDICDELGMCRQNPPLPALDHHFIGWSCKAPTDYKKPCDQPSEKWNDSGFTCRDSMGDLQPCCAVGGKLHNFIQQLEDNTLECVKRGPDPVRICATRADCNNHGSCVQNNCECDPGWNGSTCEFKNCEDSSMEGKCASNWYLSDPGPPPGYWCELNSQNCGYGGCEEQYRPIVETSFPDPNDPHPQCGCHCELSHLRSKQRAQTCFDAFPGDLETDWRCSTTYQNKYPAGLAPPQPLFDIGYSCNSNDDCINGHCVYSAYRLGPAMNRMYCAPASVAGSGKNDPKKWCTDKPHSAACNPMWPCDNFKSDTTCDSGPDSGEEYTLFENRTDFPTEVAAQGECSDRCNNQLKLTAQKARRINLYVFLTVTAVAAHRVQNTGINVYLGLRVMH